MPSIDSKELVDELIENDGYYSDDPRVLAIHQYTNSWGGETYHLAYNESEIASLFLSPFCSNIRLLWTHDEEMRMVITDEELINKLKEE